MKIFLVGMPGSGKSTLGLQLAKHLQLKFMDTDTLIVSSEDRTIDEIFNTQGEAYFRNKEREALIETIQEENAVISTGGGLPCFFDNMEIINQNGISVFLNVPPAVLVQRLRKGKNKNRPMVVGKTNADLLQFLQGKYEERISFYSMAKITISHKNISWEEVAEKIKLFMPLN